MSLHIPATYAKVQHLTIHQYWTVSVAGHTDNSIGQGNHSITTVWLLLPRERRIDLLPACYKRYQALDSGSSAAVHPTLCIAIISACHISLWDLGRGNCHHHTDAPADCCAVSYKLPYYDRSCYIYFSVSWFSHSVACGNPFKYGLNSNLNLFNCQVIFHDVDIPNNLAVHLLMNIHSVSSIKQCHNKSEYLMSLWNSTLVSMEQIAKS